MNVYIYMFTHKHVLADPTIVVGIGTEVGMLICLIIVVLSMMASIIRAQYLSIKEYTLSS